jgi:uncharacterized low-complexity protein
MSGTDDIKRVLLAAMAAAALVVVLAVPYKAQAASDCSSAGSDPTAAQYCPPTEPKEKECTEGGSGNSGSNSGNSGSESCEEVTPAPPSPAPPAPAPEPEPEPEPAPAEGGSLPFTGDDVPALLAIAAVFIAAGVALQRLSRPKAERS